GPRQRIERSLGSTAPLPKSPESAISYSVLLKRRDPAGGNRLGTAELWRECRTTRSSSRISRQAVSLRQKPVAIGTVDSEDRGNGGGMTIVTRVFCGRR